MKMKPLGLAGSIIWFGIPALLLLAGTRLLIPFLIRSGIHGLYSWYICGGTLMGGMLVTAWTAAGKENRLKRLRLGKLTKTQLKTTAVTTIITLAGTGVIWFLLNTLMGPADSMMPPFLQGTVIPGQNRALLFLVWLPVFFCNIMGEELLWRGYLLPRQEEKFGNKAWILNGLLWIIFHIPFGLRTILMVIPVFFALPRMARITRSTWPGIILHGVLNGPAFAAILLGLI